jgi:iron complex outermembrane recepter protein
LDNLENKPVMRNRVGRRLFRNVLLGGVSTLAAGTFSAAAIAQDNGQPVETVVVTGIIGSLQRDLDIKRNSLGLVDAITAEDVGKFPDLNLAQAMMRIPGVTVTRQASTMGGTGGVSTNGEATEITVRGFGPTFNETLIDGREVATGAGDRAFDFSSVNSDFVSQIDVLKTPDASMSSGAIGATVNIKFPKPFDHPGLEIVGSLSGEVSPERGSLAPNGDFLISDTFANDTFGILIAGSYEDVRTRQNHINVQGWEGKTMGTDFTASQFAGTAPATGSPLWFIQDYGIYHELQNTERLQGRVVLQWRPTDALEVTVNDNFSRFDEHQAQYGYSVWFNSGSLQNVQVDQNGTIVNFVQPNTPTDFQGQYNPQILQFNDYGANVKWTLNENFSIVLDGDHADGWSNPGGVVGADMDVGYGPSQAPCNPANNSGYPCPVGGYAGGLYGANVGIAVPGGHGLPYPTSFGPSGNEANFINNGLIGSHVLPLSEGQNLDTVNQVKAEGDWSEDNLDLKFGFQYLAEHKNEMSADSFENNNWQAYSGYGPASNNYYIDNVNPADPYYGQPAGVALPQDMFQKSFSTSGFINGWTGSGNLPSNILQYDPWPTIKYLESLGNPQTMLVPGYNGTGNGCCAPPPNEAGRPFNGIYQVAFNPSNYHVLMEKTYSGYVQASLKTNVADMPLRINLGTRYDYTDEDVEGLGRVPTAFTVDAADHTAYDITYTGTTPVTGHHSYQYLLPNLDFILSVTDNLDVRFDVSRTLTRPPISQLSPTYNISAQRTNDVAATGGNPNLLPFLSDNVDLGAQWYYAPNSYVSIDTFLKSVDNFIITGSTQQVFTGVGPGGTNINYTLTQPVNGPAANVYGIEIALQHVFSDTGFGFQVNGTIVGTDKPYDPLNLAVSNFAVTGLADSANMVAFYDKNGFQIRLAANWQDSVLDHFGQIQNGSSFGAEPTFVNTSWNMDLSTSYDITSQITAYAEALNLTDATYSTHGRFSNQVLDVVDYGRKFIFGVHFKY